MRRRRLATRAVIAGAACLLMTVGFYATPAAADDYDEEMWTDDPTPRGGKVLFDRTSNINPGKEQVLLCDEDYDEHYVSLRIGEAGRYRLSTKGNGVGCVVWYNIDLPGPGPWQFRICLRQAVGDELYEASCDYASWFADDI